MTVSHIGVAAFLSAAMLTTIIAFDANTAVLAVLAIASFGNAIFRYSTDKAQRRRDAVLQHTANSIHELTNSNFAAQLRINATSFKNLVVATKRLAETTHADGDIASYNAAENGLKEAEKSLVDHMLQQAKVDATNAVRAL